jgi:hypothetical protein
MGLNESEINQMLGELDCGYTTWYVVNKAGAVGEDGVPIELARFHEEWRAKQYQRAVGCETTMRNEPVVRRKHVRSGLKRDANTVVGRRAFSVD